VVEPRPYCADGSSFHERTVHLERRLVRAFTCRSSLRPRRDDHIVPVQARRRSLTKGRVFGRRPRNLSSIQPVATKRGAESWRCIYRSRSSKARSD
jgi:hypothetical protein